uniref:Neuropeptide FF receptor 1 like 1 n=1 Tax=Sinocyclocheilus grahami TaxID=75366 RepID=A0A672KEK8_SINGR
MNKMTLNHNAVNFSLANCTLLPYYIHSVGMAVSYILSYLLVLLLCVVGNGLVCLVVIRNHNMRSVTNLFILNLAISDLLVGIFCVPTTLIDSLISGWPFSQITCTMSNLIQGMSVSASVFTLVAIAVDRFMGIVYPFHHRLRPATAFFAIIFIWLLSFCCNPDIRSRRRMKVIKMLIMVAILFMVSWLPLWTLMLLTDYQDLDRQQIDFLSSYLFPVAHWLAFFNSGVNPIIYGFFNENFRRGFQATVACGSCRSFVSEMRHTHFALLPPNRVSDGNHDVTSMRKERCFAVMPQGRGHGIQGILLEDTNGITASHRVLGAWME